MKSRTRLAVLVILILLLVGGASVGVYLVNRPPLHAGPMVQLLTPDGFTVVWRTRLSGPMHLRVFGETGEPGEQFAAACDGGRCVAGAEGLAPGTRYPFEVIGEGGKVLGRGSARTSPEPDGTFTFMVFGDSGTGDAYQYDLARRMAEWDVDFIVHTGDLIYPAGVPRYYPKRFYAPYAPLIARAAFYPCLGNHDYSTDRGQPLLDEFELPHNGPEGDTPGRHYWFDIADARFIAIDSNLRHDLLDTYVAEWLDEVLADAGDRWKIVFFHHAVFTFRKPTYRIREALVPVFDQHEVDLVLVGHNHLYERTHPLDDDRVVPDGEGTVHITSGAGGAHIHKVRGEVPDFIATYYDEKHSFTIIEAAPSIMSLRQINVDGEVIDAYDILRRRGVAAVAGTDRPSGAQAVAAR